MIDTVSTPSYYRVRTVKITDSGFIGCSCGYPARMKMPCRHIIAVVRKTDERMYGVRWHQMFQHCFLRKGKDRITHLYMDLEKKERLMDRNKYEHCIITHKREWLNSLGSDFPILLNGTTVEEYNEMKELHELKEKGILAIRGDDLSVLKENSNRNVLGKVDEETELFLSQETTRMRDVEYAFEKNIQINTLQSIQSSMLPKWQSTYTSKYHEMLAISTNMLKSMGDNNDLYQKYMAKFKSLETECLKECATLHVKVEKNSQMHFP